MADCLNQAVRTQLGSKIGFIPNASFLGLVSILFMYFGLSLDVIPNCTEKHS